MAGKKLLQERDKKLFFTDVLKLAGKVFVSFQGRQ